MQRVLLPRGILILLVATACSDPTSGLLEVEAPSELTTAAASSGFVAINLGAATPYPRTTATAINELGQVIGQGSGDAKDFIARAFLWENGVVTDLGTLGGETARAVALNDQGQIVGNSATADSELHAFLWQAGVMSDLQVPGLKSTGIDISEAGTVLGSAEGSPFLWEGGTITFLPTLDGAAAGARQLNEAGQAVGSSRTVAGYTHAVLWDGEAITDLGTLGGSSSGASALNGSGQVTGSGRTPTDAVHAFLWENGVMKDLGTLGGWSFAVDINEVGQVVGYFTTGSGRHAFLWENGVMQDLGTLGGSSSQAEAINDDGQVVGYSDTSEGTTHAFLWEDGTMIDLGTLGGDGSWARSINEAGQVIGHSVTATGDVHATLWRRVTPVERLSAIATDVRALEVDGSLNQGQAGSLVNKLNIATAMIDDGKTTPARNQLGAFVEEVEALVAVDVLAPEEGQPLVDAANAAIAELG